MHISIRSFRNWYYHLASDITPKIAIFRMCYGGNGTVKFLETLPENVFRHNYAMVQIKNQRLSRACIVHLVIKRTNWSYVKTMSCSGSHLGITINIKNTKFVKDLPMIDAQFRFNQCNSFREEYISVFSPYGSVLIL